MRRWKNSTKTRIGRVMITAAAAMLPMGFSNDELPVKKAMAAGTVRELLVEVNEMAKRKSFQQNRNTRIDAVTRPGMARGAMTRTKDCSGVAPSISAARSRSRGISRKNEERM